MGGSQGRWMDGRWLMWGGGGWLAGLGLRGGRELAAGRWQLAAGGLAAGSRQLGAWPLAAGGLAVLTPFRYLVFFLFATDRCLFT